jgi:hypothetical protein
MSQQMKCHLLMLRCESVILYTRLQVKNWAELEFKIIYRTGTTRIVALRCYAIITREINYAFYVTWKLQLNLSCRSWSFL